VTFKLSKTTSTIYLTGAKNGCYVSIRISVKFYQLQRNIAVIEKTRYQIPTYEGSITTLVTVNCEKDVGVNIDSNLKFHQHIQTKVNKANQIIIPKPSNNVNINTESSKSLISDDESEPNIEEQADLLHLEQT